MKEVKNEEEILNNEGLTIVKAYGDWCIPCKMYTEHFEAVAKEYSDKASFYSLDVLKHEDFTKKYGVRGVPTTLFFENGKLLVSAVGVNDEKKLKSLINDVMEHDKDE